MLAVLLQTAASGNRNVEISAISRNSKTFLEIDPMGVGMTAIGMAVVFVSLFLLYILFLNTAKLLNFKIPRDLRIRKKKEGKSTSELFKGLSPEENVAIALALHLYTQEIHDNDSYVLTINKVARTYSPWSSKIYGLRHYPRN